jgi:dual-specificity kinase
MQVPLFLKAVFWFFSNNSLQEFIPSNTSFNKQLLDLLRKIFVYDPKARITAKQALKHPWFKESLIDDGTEALRIRDKRVMEEETRQVKRLREA